VEAFEAAEDPSAVRSRIESLKPAMQKSKRDALRADKEFDAQVRDVNPIRKRLTQVGVELNSLKDGREMKLQQVQRQDNVAHAAFAWISDPNRGGRKLKKKVRGSIRLSQVCPFARKLAPRCKCVCSLQVESLHASPVRLCVGCCEPALPWL
jgi:hypothetical protein